MTEYLCPLIRDKKGENQPCMQDKCMLYMRLNGTDKNTGAPVNNGYCAMSATPMILIEVRQALDGLQKATEQGRNRTAEVGQLVIKNNEQTKDLLQGLASVAQGIQAGQFPPKSAPAPVLEVSEPAS